MEKQRRCVDCCTITTPLWRGGPTVPRSLCNACGIRYRKKKKKKNGVGLNKSGKPKLGKKPRETSLTVKVGIGDEEQAAALLLMALSSAYL